MRYKKSRRWNNQSDKHMPAPCVVTDLTLDETGPIRHVQQNKQGSWEYEKYLFVSDNFAGGNFAQLYVMKQTMRWSWL